MGESGGKPPADAGQGAADAPTDKARLPSAKVRHGIKTALSLTLAYLIPMSMGWPQPQTAAITVMLIAATGLASDSLQKGVLRVLGTGAGAVIGLSLIALFPQDRMTYLLAVSVAVALIAYLYNAYQGDSTLLMLTVAVILMVFNGGDAEGAFLYGVDRALMTAFGVIVYTVVATALWPVRAVDNSRQLAGAVTEGYRQAFALLSQPANDAQGDIDRALAALVAKESTFQAHFARVKGNAEGVATYLAEWRSVVRCYEELEAILLPALRQQPRQAVDFGRYLNDYQAVLERIEVLFARVASSWQGQATADKIGPLPVSYRERSLRGEPHLTVAAVAARAELLRKIQVVLLELCAALDSMVFDRGDFRPGRAPRGKPAFIWLDLENAKTAVRAFLVFWLATAIWIGFNPPGGFMFVTLATLLVLLVSYTPVSPKVLFILFSMGFAFAVPAYIFLLPQMTHWLELAVFMFGYSFIGFYAFQGPVSIFFMLGMFSLGIQNTMNYNFDAILLVVMLFYLVCALLIIATHVPFTSKPERLFSSARARFFRACGRTLELTTVRPGLPRLLCQLRATNSAALLAKMHSWGAMVDHRYFTANSAQDISHLLRACDLLHGQLQVFARRRDEFSNNPLVMAARENSRYNLLAELCDELARNPCTASEASGPFAAIDTRLAQIRRALDELRQDTGMPDQYGLEELAHFYVYLNLQATLLDNIRACRTAQQMLDWHQLAEPRF
jgi:uncharacterized membrane protein YccC